MVLMKMITNTNKIMVSMKIITIILNKIMVSMKITHPHKYANRAQRRQIQNGGLRMTQDS